MVVHIIANLNAADASPSIGDISMLEVDPEFGVYNPGTGVELVDPEDTIPFEASYDTDDPRGDSGFILVTSPVPLEYGGLSPLIVQDQRKCISGAELDSLPIGLMVYDPEGIAVLYKTKCDEDMGGIYTVRSVSGFTVRIDSTNTLSLGDLVFLYDDINPTFVWFYTVSDIVTDHEVAYSVGKLTVTLETVGGFSNPALLGPPTTLNSMGWLYIPIPYVESLARQTATDLIVARLGSNTPGPLTVLGIITTLPAGTPDGVCVYDIQYTVSGHAELTMGTVALSNRQWVGGDLVVMLVGVPITTEHRVADDKIICEVVYGGSEVVMPETWRIQCWKGVLGRYVNRVDDTRCLLDVRVSTCYN
jgi:hypothetical protein